MFTLYHQIAKIQHKQVAMKQLTEQHTSHQPESDITQLKSQLATQQVSLLYNHLIEHTLDKKILSTWLNATLSVD